MVRATDVVPVAFVSGAAATGIAAGGGAACGGAATGGVTCEGVAPGPGDGGVAGAAAAVAAWPGSWLAVGPWAGEAAPTNMATIAATPQLAAVVTIATFRCGRRARAIPTATGPPTRGGARWT